MGEENGSFIPLCAERLARELVQAGGLRQGIGREIRVEQELSSTNDRMAEWARAGVPEGVVLFAERQTAGRGRLQRAWESAPGEGLAFSILLRPPPSWPLSDWARLSTWAGLGVARGIESVFPGLRAGLKWPNDVYLQGKKVAGILCESTLGQSADGYAGKLTDEQEPRVESLGWVVVGIGLNVNQLVFPEMLKDRAISLRQAVALKSLAAESSLEPTDPPPSFGPFPLLDRHGVAAAILRALDATYGSVGSGGLGLKAPPFQALLKEASERSVLLGRQITVYPLAGEPYPAWAEALAFDGDHCGGLWVRRNDGSRVLLSSGEVSVR